MSSEGPTMYLANPPWSLRVGLCSNVTREGLIMCHLQVNYDLAVAERDMPHGTQRLTQECHHTNYHNANNDKQRECGSD